MLARAQTISALAALPCRQWLCECQQPCNNGAQKYGSVELDPTTYLLSSVSGPWYGGATDDYG